MHTDKLHVIFSFQFVQCGFTAAIWTSQVKAMWHEAQLLRACHDAIFDGVEGGFRSA